MRPETFHKNQRVNIKHSHLPVSSPLLSWSCPWGTRMLSRPWMTSEWNNKHRNERGVSHEAGISSAAQTNKQTNPNIHPLFPKRLAFRCDRRHPLTVQSPRRQKWHFYANRRARGHVSKVGYLIGIPDGPLNPDDAYRWESTLDLSPLWPFPARRQTRDGLRNLRRGSLLSQLSPDLHDSRDRETRECPSLSLLRIQLNDRNVEAAVAAAAARRLRNLALPGKRGRIFRLCTLR